jgi:hypothetical protein
VKYEPLTVLLYEDLYHTKLKEFGCIPHRQYPFLGASPDGINNDPTNGRYGRMVEIKNIKNRDITGVPKLDYWIQTQIQMEVCDLDICDFVESRMLEYANEEEFYGDETDRVYKGVVLRFMDASYQSIEHKYEYYPIGGNYGDCSLSIEQQKRAIGEWTKTTQRRLLEEGWRWADTNYWYLDEWSCVVIDRNRAWFQAVLPRILMAWNIIERERETGEYWKRVGTKKKTATKRTPICVVLLDDE